MREKVEVLPLFPMEDPIVVSQEVGDRGGNGGWRLGMTKPAAEERNEVTLPHHSLVLPHPCLLACSQNKWEVMLLGP